MCLPDGADTVRDATGLVLAVLRGDEEGQEVILVNADQQSLVHLLAAMVAAFLTAAVCRCRDDPDAPPHALTAEQLAEAEAILMAGIEGPDDDLSP